MSTASDAPGWRSSAQRGEPKTPKSRFGGSFCAEDASIPCCHTLAIHGLYIYIYVCVYIYIYL